MFLLPGIAAFCLFILFDMNKIRWHNRLCNSFFTLGALLLMLSTVLCIRESLSAGVSLRPLSIAALAAALLSLAALIYALFFALPFDSTYRQSGGLPLVSSGIYGLCRHPGFWPFLLVYVFLWLGLGSKALLAAMLIYPLCDLIYIIIQDKYIFPLYIEGYASYKLSVPFLIPRRRR